MWTLAKLHFGSWAIKMGWPRSTVQKGHQSNESFQRERPWNRTISTWVHQTIAFAIASEFCRKHPFARNFRSEDEISAISFLQFHSQNRSHSLANSFATVNCKQTISVKNVVWVQTWHCEVWEDCRRFWVWVLGVSYLGRAATQEKQSRKNRSKNSLEKFA